MATVIDKFKTVNDVIKQINKADEARNDKHTTFVDDGIRVVMLKNTYDTFVDIAMNYADILSDIKIQKEDK